MMHAVVPSFGPEDPCPAAIHLSIRAREATLELSGDLTSSGTARDMVRQLQTIQRRLPTAIEVVHLDLTGLKHITIDVAVLLSVQRRLLAPRGIQVGTVTQQRGAQCTASVTRVLDTLSRPSLSTAPTKE